MNKTKIVEMNEEITQQISYMQPNQRLKKILGIVMPPILWLIMFLTYQLYGVFFGNEIGWHLGLYTYWILCGLIFPATLIGFKRIKEVSAPRKFRLKMLPVILFPLAMAFLFNLIPGLEYEKISVVGIIFLIITSFGNGIFEEILWRGVYMELYPNNNFMRIGYSTFWYAVFHFASGSLSSNGNILGLVIGSAFFGIFLSLLAKWKNNIWWSILSHVLGGLVMIS